MGSRLAKVGTVALELSTCHHQLAKWLVALSYPHHLFTSFVQFSCNSLVKQILEERILITSSGTCLLNILERHNLLRSNIPFIPVAIRKCEVTHPGSWDVGRVVTGVEDRQRED